MSWFEYGTMRIYYEEEGQGDPVLLLPGFAGSIGELVELRKALAANYKVISADLPGSGGSQPQPRTYTRTYLEDDAHLFIDMLNQSGKKPAHLVGFSDGGEVSLLMAALSPEIARSVAVWGAAGKIDDPEGQLRAATYNVVDNPIPPLQQFSDYLRATYGEANARAMTQSFVEALTQIIENGGDKTLSIAHQITCPVLLIAGEHDPFAPPALVAELAARIDKVETINLKAAGHGIHQERSEWLSQTISDWLSKQ